MKIPIACSFLHACMYPVNLAHPHVRQKKISLLLLKLLEILHRHKLANNIILLRKPLLPAPQRIHLLSPQIRQRVQRPIQILSQHVLIEAPARKPAARIPTRKVCVRPARPVKVTTTGNVKDGAADGEEDGGAVFAVEGQQGVRVVGLEDDGRRGLGELWVGRFGEEG